MKLLPLRRASILTLFIGLLFGSSLPVLHAAEDMRTLTDKQGRSLRAELVSVADDTVTIKRDDGETFSIPLSSLSEADQKDIKAWAAKQAALIPAGSVQLQMSRLIFHTVQKPAGTGATATIEDWGYGVALKNRTSKTLTGIRMDCILFVQPGLNPGQTTHSPLKQITSSRVLGPVAAFDTLNFHTNSITVTRVDLAAGYMWNNGSLAPVVDELHGVWLRFYVGDQLVAETCSPEDISSTQKWTNP